MVNKNPIHEAIYKNVVRPAMTARKMSVEGSIIDVNYEEQTAQVYWRDPDGGAERQSRNVPLPVDGNGVYTESVKMGDRVTLAFKNGNHANPYITIVHKKQNTNYESKNGAGIPKEIVNAQGDVNWQTALMDLHYGHEKINHGWEDARDYKIKEDEIALKHPVTGAIVKLTDDGLIDVFADPQTGIRINPHNKSVDLFGDKVNITANSFNVKTRVSSTSKKIRYSTGMISIMKDLGLPVEDVDKGVN